MTYALIDDDAIAVDQNGRQIEQPRLPDLVHDGTRWWDLRGLDTETAEPLAELAGWLPVTPVARPADTASVTYTRSLTLVAGVPTETWTQRNKTAEEIANETAAANSATLRSNPETQIAEMVAALTALTAVRQRTNNDINANPAAALKDALQEILTITRRVIRLARLDLGVLDSTEGT